MRWFVVIALAIPISLFAPLPDIGSAQHHARSAGRHPTTIDCPPRASLTTNQAATAEAALRAGSARWGRVLATAAPPVWRADGVITYLSLGGRTLDIDGVALQIDSRSVILVDCKRAPMRELREGSSVTALYEEREGRNVVIVIEGQSDDE